MLNNILNLYREDINEGSQHTSVDNTELFLPNKSARFGRTCKSNQDTFNNNNNNNNSNLINVGYAKYTI